MTKIEEQVKLLMKICDKECELSPENLSCDGMLRGRALRAKASRLTKELKTLQSKFEKLYGREAEFDEIWDSHSTARKMGII